MAYRDEILRKALELGRTLDDKGKPLGWSEAALNEAIDILGEETFGQLVASPWRRRNRPGFRGAESLGENLHSYVARAGHTGWRIQGPRKPSAIRRRLAKEPPAPHFLPDVEDAKREARPRGRGVSQRLDSFNPKEGVRDVAQLMGREGYTPSHGEAINIFEERLSGEKITGVIAGRGGVGISYENADAGEFAHFFRSLPAEVKAHLGQGSHGRTINALLLEHQANIAEQYAPTVQALDDIRDALQSISLQLEKTPRAHELVRDKLLKRQRELNKQLGIHARKITRLRGELSGTQRSIATLEGRQLEAISTIYRDPVDIAIAEEASRGGGRTPLDYARALGETEQDRRAMREILIAQGMPADKSILSPSEQAALRINAELVENQKLRSHLVGHRAFMRFYGQGMVPGMPGSEDIVSVSQIAPGGRFRGGHAEIGLETMGEFIGGEESLIDKFGDINEAAPRVSQRSVRVRSYNAMHEATMGKLQFSFLPRHLRERDPLSSLLGRSTGFDTGRLINETSRSLEPAEYMEKALGRLNKRMTRTIGEAFEQNLEGRGLSDLGRFRDLGAEGELPAIQQKVAALLGLADQHAAGGVDIVASPSRVAQEIIMGFLTGDKGPYNLGAYKFEGQPLNYRQWLWQLLNPENELTSDFEKKVKEALLAGVPALDREGSEEFQTFQKALRDYAGKLGLPTSSQHYGTLVEKEVGTLRRMGAEARDRTLPLSEGIDEFFADPYSQQPFDEIDFVLSRQQGEIVGVPVGYGDMPGPEELVERARINKEIATRRGFIQKIQRYAYPVPGEPSPLDAEAQRKADEMIARMQLAIKQAGGNLQGVRGKADIREQIGILKAMYGWDDRTTDLMADRLARAQGFQTDLGVPDDPFVGRHADILQRLRNIEEAEDIMTMSVGPDGTPVNFRLRDVRSIRHQIDEDVFEERIAYEMELAGNPRQRQEAAKALFAEQWLAEEGFDPADLDTRAAQLLTDGWTGDTVEMKFSPFTDPARRTLEQLEQRALSLGIDIPPGVTEAELEALIKRRAIYRSKAGQDMLARALESLDESGNYMLGFEPKTLPNQWPSPDSEFFDLRRPLKPKGVGKDTPEYAAWVDANARREDNIRLFMENEVQKYYESNVDRFMPSYGEMQVVPNATSLSEDVEKVTRTRFNYIQQQTNAAIEASAQRGANTATRDAHLINQLTITRMLNIIENRDKKEIDGRRLNPKALLTKDSWRHFGGTKEGKSAGREAYERTIRAIDQTLRASGEGVDWKTLEDLSRAMGDETKFTSSADALTIMKAFSRDRPDVAQIVAEKGRGEVKAKMAAPLSPWSRIAIPGVTEAGGDMSLGEAFMAAMVETSEPEVLEDLKRSDYANIDAVENIADALTRQVRTMREDPKVFSLLPTSVQKVLIASSPEIQSLSARAAARKGKGKITATDIMKTAEEVGSPEGSEHLVEAMMDHERMAEEAARAAAEGKLRPTSQLAAEAKAPRPIRPSIARIRELFEERPNLRVAAIGLGALGGLGILHKILKRRQNTDRTEEEAGLPRYIPGGGGYDGRAPAYPVTAMGLPNYGAAPNNGVIYQVNARGDFDPSVLQSQIESITGTSPYGTIYDNKPLYDANPDLDEIINNY